MNITQEISLPIPTLFQTKNASEMHKCNIKYKMPFVNLRIHKGILNAPDRTRTCLSDFLLEWLGYCESASDADEYCFKSVLILSIMFVIFAICFA